MEHPLLPTLRRLGLGDHEARVYHALLRRSPAGASWLAQECGLQRSSVYTTLAALTSKGLVGTSYRNNVKQFAAEGVDALEAHVAKERERAEERVRLVASSADAFRALTAPAALIPDVTVFEGQEGLKRIYLSMLRDAPEGSTMRILRDEFIWDDAWQFVFGRAWHDRVKKLKAGQEISTLLLVNPSREERSHAAYYRSRKELRARMLPAAQATERFALYMVGDIVSTLSFEQGHLVGVRVTNRHIAANMARVFDGLWAGASSVR